MMKCNRSATPDFLETHGATWSSDWVSKCEDSDENKSSKFSWGSHSGKYINHLILEHLRGMTSNHCSYCDGYPLNVTGFETIDHFKPKGKGEYPELSYIWNNLYLACEKCQGHKKSRYEDKLLRPDDPRYEFDNHFIYNEINGEIEPNPTAIEEDRNRALCSIDIFGLNQGGRPSARKRELKKFRSLYAIREHGEFNDWPFRFLLINEIDEIASGLRTEMN